MRIWLGIVVTASLTTGALAQFAEGHRSEFTGFDNCEDRDPGDLAPYLQICLGPQGQEIWLPYSEHSSAMAIGPNGIEAQLDERPSLAGLDMMIGPVIDWRYRPDGDEPYAAIVRYRGLTPNYNQETGEYTGGTTTNSNILVVIALRADEQVSACHMAYINAMEMPNANEIAHDLAADLEPRFVCGETRYLNADHPAWD
jgi:hypothetical protein